MSKLTSIEELIEHLNDYGFDLSLHKFEIEQAKKMHKQEIIDAWEDGQDCEYEYHINNAPKYDKEMYYNETYQSVDTNEMIELPKQNDDVREDDVEKLDNRKDKLETLAKLLAKCWFYCDWRWENPNERVMQMLMQDLGLYPFKDEDEMIQQTKIDEGLDKQLYKEASMRIPTYGKLSEDIVESKIEDDVEVHPLEILRNKIKNEIGKPMMSSSYYGGYKQGLIEVENMVMDMLAQFPQQKENTYTEEQVMEAIEMAKKQLFIYTSEEIIISLKQPK